VFSFQDIRHRALDLGISSRRGCPLRWMKMDCSFIPSTFLPNFRRYRMSLCVPFVRRGLRNFVWPPDMLFVRRYNSWPILGQHLVISIAVFILSHLRLRLTAGIEIAPLHPLPRYTRSCYGAAMGILGFSRIQVLGELTIVYLGLSFSLSYSPHLRLCTDHEV